MGARKTLPRDEIERRWLARETQEQIARAVGTHQPTISRIVRELGLCRGYDQWRPEEDAEIRDGLKCGLSMREIAAKLPGRTRNMVIGRAWRLSRRSS